MPLSRSSRFANLDRNRSVGPCVVQRDGTGQAGSLNSGQVSGALQQSLEERAVIAIQDVNSSREDPACLEAGVHPLQLNHRPQGQPGPNQEDHGERELGRNEQATRLGIDSTR